MDLPFLIKRCLTHGVVILPYALDSVLSRYELNQIPDDVLGKFNKDELDRYVKALYLCTCEMAREWTEGHEILKELGFHEKRREEGHRVFLSLEYKNV
jgi:hypothetical protein